ncbi:uncharacterized protein LOC142351046 isoform X3 [Convolutriloba macropyga]|uniref:uncharacterized protein LOC142351046 isoform X3 n=1 Tax=Convolutriloba macropyga TaxID=536237 RepID=UPI003F51BA23
MFVIINLLQIFVITSLVSTSTCNLVNDQPITQYSNSKTGNQQFFHLDSGDHYRPNEIPGLDQIVYWKEFIYLTAKDNIFKIYRNSSNYYKFIYSISLPQSGNCSVSRSQPEVCQRRVQFLLPYEKNSLLGCYSYNLQPHFFKLDGTDFTSLEPSDVLVNALRIFCSVDPKVDSLTFGGGPQSDTFFLAKGTRAGFELEMMRIEPPSALDKIRNADESETTQSDMFSLDPGVKTHLKTQNLLDITRIGKGYPVTQFNFGQMTFVTFRERAVEFKGVEDFKNTLFSRIAKVCDVDQGGRKLSSFDPVSYWTSFAKTRLICSVPGTPEFHFNEIQDTAFFESGNGFMFGIFDTPYTEMRTSAICMYGIESVLDSFGGDHYNAELFKAPFQKHPDIIKDYRPNQCTNRTTDIDSELVAFLQENPLMEEPVRPVSGEPVFRVAGASFRLTSIVGENAQWLNTDASTHFVLYTGTSDGRVLKLLINMTSISPQTSSSSTTKTRRTTSSSTQQTILNTTWVTEWQVFSQSAEVKKVQIDPGSRQLIVTSESEVIVLPKSRCESRKAPPAKNKCRDCLITRDPHCFWDIVTTSCVYYPGQSPNVSYNAYSKYPNMEELCTPFDHINIPPVVLVETGTTPGVKEGGDLGSDVTKGSADGGAAVNGISDIDTAHKPGNLPNDGKGNQEVSDDPIAATVAPGSDPDAAVKPNTLQQGIEVTNIEPKNKDKKLLTITLVTAVPCVILGVLAGMGLLYCYAFYKANKHSRVSKSSPNELIYAPIAIGKSPSGSSETQHPDNSYMYQQVYAQYLQIDPQQEEKHYSTIGSTPRPGSELHASCNNLVMSSQFGVHTQPNIAGGGTIGRNGVSSGGAGGGLTGYPSMRATVNHAAALQANNDNMLTTSGMYNGGASNGLSSSQLAESQFSNNRNPLGLDRLNPGLDNGAPISVLGASSLSRLNSASVYNMPNQSNHIQPAEGRNVNQANLDLNAKFPQHHTVAPTSSHLIPNNPRAPLTSRNQQPQLHSQQHQQPHIPVTSAYGAGAGAVSGAAAYNLPQSHSMLNYSHSQLNSPGNLLRDSTQLLGKVNGSNYAASDRGSNSMQPQQQQQQQQYRSDTKLFQPIPSANGMRPAVNNTYGEDAISSKVLLFSTNQSRNTPTQQNGSIISSSLGSSQNIPMIRKPTSVKYNKKSGKPNTTSVADPQILNMQPHRGRSDSMHNQLNSSINQNNQQSVYRSDYELSSPERLSSYNNQSSSQPSQSGGGYRGNMGGGVASGRFAPVDESRLALQYGGVQTSENPLYGAPDYQSQVAHRLARNGSPTLPNSPKLPKKATKQQLPPASQLLKQQNNRSTPPSNSSGSQFGYPNSLQNSATGKFYPTNANSGSNPISPRLSPEAEYMDLEEFSVASGNNSEILDHDQLTIDI